MHCVSEFTRNKKFGFEWPILLEYLGPFRVEGDDEQTRAEFVQSKLQNTNTSRASTPVVLVISVAGIEAWNRNLNGQKAHLHLSYPLRRISYALCDPDLRLYAFLARESNDPPTEQCCHVFLTQTGEEAERMSMITGNAFSLAYAFLQKQDKDEQTTFHEAVSKNIDENRRMMEERNEKQDELKKQVLGYISNTQTASERMKDRKKFKERQLTDECKEIREGFRQSGRSKWAKKEVKRVQHKRPFSSGEKDKINTPTITSAPSPLINDVREAFQSLESANRSPVTCLKDTIDAHFENYERSMLEQQQREEERRQSILSIVENSMTSEQESSSSTSRSIRNRPLPDAPSTGSSSLEKSGSDRIRNGSGDHKDLNDIELIKRPSSPRRSTSITPPPLPPRENRPSTIETSSTEFEFFAPESDEEGRRLSDNGVTQNSKASIDEDFTQYPWFYSGVPRESILEFLSQQEFGSFVIRESTSEIGCFALSLKVPNYSASPGEPRFILKHYLIEKTPCGRYRFQKGPDKEWATLASLVTHLTVLKEVLPVELRLPRTARNPSFKFSIQPELRIRRRVEDSDDADDEDEEADIRQGISSIEVASPY
ncbi:DgyrCDS7705 [Dimorphilus gyrociliatus]|uniref:DgyrCDS7705 n=1 Tax=Dimorphilus gyrociliatus TaxID=2664684 RepID=A0A7I8VRY6_9ANNE|nr:DgyrCDS7705 [Dimorphilus gyrociliatus]